MAIKDWKKVGKYSWKNKKIDATLHFTLIPNKDITYVNYAEFDIHNLWKNGFSKRFNTKSKALSFAKSYMRKH